jgi:hypothetical protein
MTFLDFDRRKVQKLEVFNRWGKICFFQPTGIPTIGQKSDENSGVYFFKVEFENPDTNEKVF